MWITVMSHNNAYKNSHRKEFFLFFIFRIKNLLDKKNHWRSPKSTKLRCTQIWAAFTNTIALSLSHSGPGQDMENKLSDPTCYSNPCSLPSSPLISSPKSWGSGHVMMHTSFANTRQCTWTLQEMIRPFKFTFKPSLQNPLFTTTRIPTYYHHPSPMASLSTLSTQKDSLSSQDEKPPLVFPPFHSNSRESNWV